MNSRTVSKTLALSALAFCFTGSCPAAEILFDDFNDGDVTDGMPISWAEIPPFDGDLDATSGDLVLTPFVSSSLQTTVVTTLGINASDVSIRARARISDAPSLLGTVSLMARSDRGNYTSYFGGIIQDGTVFIDRDGTGPTTSLVETETDLRPVEEDVMIQLDVFGSTLEMWAWRAGEQIPSEPLLTLTDSVYSDGGEVGFYYAALDSSLQDLGRGTFRHIRVSDTHIPEPASLMLTGLACAAFALIAACKRRAAITCGKL